MKDWKLASLVAVVFVLLHSGCVGSNNGVKDTLALSDYRDVDVAVVKVVAPTPYDPDKQAETLRQGLQNLINQSQFWFRGKSPKAIVEVKITDFHEPSSGAQFLGVDGFRIAYVISARDAVSGSSLGEAYGLKKWRIRGGVLEYGLAGAIAEHQSEGAWDETTRQESGSYQAILDMAKTIDRAKRRQSPKPAEPRVPPPGLPRGVQVTASTLQK